MMRPPAAGRRLLLLLLLVTGWAPPGWPVRAMAATGAARVAAAHARPAAPPWRLAPAAADRAVLARVLAASGVERAPRPPDRSYFGELLTTVWQWINEVIERVGEAVHLSPRPAIVFASALTIVVVGLLLAAQLRRRKRGGGAATPAGEVATMSPADPEAAAWDAAAWRAELERRLARGEIEAALQAAWWWLARTLAGARVEANWTGRELVRRSGREDLREVVGRLDAMAYGRERPLASALRALVDRLEIALA